MRIGLLETCVPFVEAEGCPRPHIKQSRVVSGEGRLPACRFRQLAENITVSERDSNASSRQAAETCRLAACAPRIRIPQSPLGLNSVTFRAHEDFPRHIHVGFAGYDGR